MKPEHSRNMKLLLLLIPLLGVVAISGCTDNKGISTGPGVQIVSWTPSLSTVDSGDSLQFRLKIQNKGETTARNVNVILTQIVAADWEIQQNTVDMIQSASGNVGFHLDELIGPDKAQNIDSSPVEFEFEAVAPSVYKGITQTYNPQIRLYYTYQTTASNFITIVNQQELKRLQDQGKTISSGTTVQSAGPLTVTINAGKFLKARENDASRQFQLNINIQNTGGGVVSPNSDTTYGGMGSVVGINSDYTVHFELVNSNSRLSISCPNLPSKGLEDNIKLFAGSSTSITCVVNIVQPPLSSEQDEIHVILDYDYYIDSSTATVTVNGQETPF